MTESTSVQAAEEPITITRIFDAPRELVFTAWTDPDHVAQWFGPAGFDTPRESVEIDLRVGGRYVLKMVRPDSAGEYWLRYEIIELVAPELLVLKSQPMPEFGLPHSTVARIELQEEAGKTLMTLTDGPYPAAGGRGAGAGWEAAFDKLAAVLARAG